MNNKDTASQSQAVPSELASLKELALAATQGPWDLEDGEVGHDVAPFVFVHKPDDDGGTDSGMRIKVEQHHEYPARKPIIGGPAWNRLADSALKNAAFIAAANPAAILKLIEQVESLSHERAAFEAWTAQDTAPIWVADIRRHGTGYVNLGTDAAWSAWQAAQPSHLLPLPFQGRPRLKDFYRSVAFTTLTLWATV